MLPHLKFLIPSSVCLSPDCIPFPCELQVWTNGLKLKGDGEGWIEGQKRRWNMRQVSHMWLEQHFQCCSNHLLCSLTTLLAVIFLINAVQQNHQPSLWCLRLASRSLLLHWTDRDDHRQLNSNVLGEGHFYRESHPHIFRPKMPSTLQQFFLHLGEKRANKWF